MAYITLSFESASLSFDLQDEDIKALFVPYGEVSSARVIMDKMTSSSRGFGFLEMEEETAARRALLSCMAPWPVARP